MYMHCQIAINRTAAFPFAAGTSAAEYDTEVHAHDYEQGSEAGRNPEELDDASTAWPPAAPRVAIVPDLPARRASDMCRPNAACSCDAPAPIGDTQVPKGMCAPQAASTMHSSALGNAMALASPPVDHRIDTTRRCEGDVARDRVDVRQRLAGMALRDKTPVSQPVNRRYATERIPRRVTALRHLVCCGVLAYVCL